MADWRIGNITAYLCNDLSVVRNRVQDGLLVRYGLRAGEAGAKGSAGGSVDVPEAGGACPGVGGESKFDEDEGA
ncbi:hypothetical protein CTheo_6276 [Ceratobasidium theobromae]|uniref:Uncharacterized protein n=1 Tax=Ceratobasidium theobromae TaxID=1582974 RepID=A0A5N5QEV1_9AGAM|nr:hypothetical protein CTheo_6276 [Ceratobasidium theobromae]